MKKVIVKMITNPTLTHNVKVWLSQILLVVWLLWLIKNRLTLNNYQPKEIQFKAILVEGIRLIILRESQIELMRPVNLKKLKENNTNKLNYRWKKKEIKKWWKLLKNRKKQFLILKEKKSDPQKCTTFIKKNTERQIWSQNLFSLGING